VYRGFARIAATVRNVHTAPSRCGFRARSYAAGDRTRRSFNTRAIPAVLIPSNWRANIHRTFGAVTGSILCSAVAHGDSWIIDFFDLEVLGPASPGVSAVRIPAPTPLLLSGIQAAMVIVNQAQHLLAQRCALHR